MVCNDGRVSDGLFSHHDDIETDTDTKTNTQNGSSLTSALSVSISPPARSTSSITPAPASSPSSKSLSPSSGNSGGGNNGDDTTPSPLSASARSRSNVLPVPLIRTVSGLPLCSLCRQPAGMFHRPCDLGKGLLTLGWIGLCSHTDLDSLGPPAPLSRTFDSLQAPSIRPDDTNNVYLFIERSTSGGKTQIEKMFAYTQRKAHEIDAR
jgi:hypothetical protein